MDPLGLTPCRYEPTALDGPALRTLLDEMRATRGNGNVLSARFRAVGVAEPEHWFRARTIAEADTNFRDLLSSRALRNALPELQVPDPYPLAGPPRFAGGWGGTLTLDGELALVLIRGGAYVSFGGSAAEGTPRGCSWIDATEKSR